MDWRETAHHAVSDESDSPRGATEMIDTQPLMSKPNL
jgi:hypothetical protein